MSKYLIYAIGEILLVVIGILIALQINNWNENRKRQQDEIHILEGIKSNLESNISLLDQDLNEFYGANSRVRSGKIIINHLENRLPYHDSLAYHFISTMDYNWENLISASYESLKSIGINLISNKKLQEDITLYYNEILPDRDYQFSILRQEYYHYIADYIPQLFEKVQYQYDSKKDFFAIPEDYQELLNNKEYLRNIMTYHDVNVHYQKRLIVTIAKTKELKSLIEAELSKLKSKRF